jgi:Na+/H+ antiporter NhaD/arsenite permease-like protein
MLEHGAVGWGIVAIFVTVYVGMFLGGLHRLKLDRSGLALVSTLAGNLLLVASIANLIVVDRARRSGIAIDVRAHARIGIPVTLATLGVVCVCLRWGL